MKHIWTNAVTSDEKKDRCDGICRFLKILFDYFMSFLMLEMFEKCAFVVSF